MDPCQKRPWFNYYHHYASPEYKDDIIIKCDDDIVFMDLTKLQEFINYRKKIFNFYKNNLKKINDKIIITPYSNNNKPSYHLFVISINFKTIKSKKIELLKFMRKNKIIFQYHYIPIYRFKLFNKKLNLSLYKGAEKYYKSSFSLPIYFNLNFNSQKRILKKIKLFFDKQ
jgi:dTDP-4-amino-4,6-dideoxygalactose transaminase